jgi:glycosyltransferase involved in cell wall biosynthesis
MIVENLPVPFDRRVWAEARTLRGAGYIVSVICPKGSGCESAEETLDDIHIFRHPLPIEARGAGGFLLEYPTALFWEFILSIKVAYRHGFDAIHACNPPDLIFIIGLFYKLLAGKKFLFDHHDVSPELYEAKFKRRGFFWRVLLLAEKLTFWTADVSIATNDSYRRIAMERGGMTPDRVFIVRSGPDLDRLKETVPNPIWRNGRDFLVSYVGVMGQSEGLDLLLTAIEYVVRHERRTDIQFVIVGTGPEWSQIVEMCQKMGLKDFVTLTGKIEDRKLFEIISTADVCVNPDRVTVMNDISTMNKIMEYMTFGKSIVQFDVKEGRISAQGASLYAKPNDPVDFGNKILELIDDPPRRIMMGRLGQRRIHETLAWEHEQPKLLQAYSCLFNLRGSLRGRSSS